VPLPDETEDKDYEHAMHKLVVPTISKFMPEMIVLVIGQDSSAFDLNGRDCLTMEGYRRIDQIMHQQADQSGGGRFLVVQEGGYYITYAAYCLHATLKGVLNLPHPLLPDPLAYYPDQVL
jgi:acetoin utilization deacetylase AcuC-like enzyme